MTHPEGFGTPAAQPVFHDLGRISFSDHSLASLLDEVTGLAARFLPGGASTSVTVLTSNRASTVAVSGDLAGELDAVQYRLGDGPCLTAAATGEPARIRDTRSPERWPDVAREAAEQGCDSLFSVPLPARDAVAASFNVYARTPAASAPERLEQLESFAGEAVHPVANMYLYQTAVERADHLAAALESRPVIDQAKGILMERFGLTPDGAFQMLVSFSMKHNIKVRMLAEEFVRTGQLPTS